MSSPEQIQRIANKAADAQARASVAEASIRAAGESIEQRAGNGANYLAEQDQNVDEFLAWMDYIGLNHDVPVGIDTERLTQQGRRREGATHSGSRPLKTHGHKVENVTSYGTRHSRIVHVSAGDDEEGNPKSFFPGDEKGTDLYVELTMKDALVANGMSGKHLRGPSPRTDTRTVHPRTGNPPPGGVPSARISDNDPAANNHGRIRRAFTWANRGPALGGRVFEEEGRPVVRAIGVRVFQGPPPDVAIVRSHNGVEAHFDEAALHLVTTDEAQLLDGAQRRELDGPRRAQEDLYNARTAGPGRGESHQEFLYRLAGLQGCVDTAVDVASRTHLPYPDPNVPNPYTNIVATLSRFVSPGPGPRGGNEVTRPVDIP